MGNKMYYVKQKYRNVYESSSGTNVTLSYIWNKRGGVMNKRGGGGRRGPCHCEKNPSENLYARQI